MKQILLTLKQKQFAAIALLVTLLIWMGGCLLPLTGAATAAPTMGNGQAADEQIDRAYSEFSQEAGLQEEIFQKRVEEGENPESLPQPYKRIQSLTDREVPETSLVETAVSKTRQLVNDLKGQSEK